MIDNTPSAYSWQQENGIPITSWYGDPRDNQLSKIVPILERLAQVDDVRDYIPKIVGVTSLNYYEAFKVLKAPREASPLDSILQSINEFKKGAAAFFTGKSINEESKDGTESEVDKKSNKR